MGFSDLEVVMKNLLDDGKYTDMTVSCDNRDFKVHRAIVCSQSTFFEAAIKDGFNELDSSRISLPEDNAETMSYVLSFCYLQDYCLAESAVVSETNQVARRHLLVYLAADKFGIQLLEQLATVRILNWAKSNVMSEGFPEVVQDIWCSAPVHKNKLRDTISDIVSTNIQDFLRHECGDSVLINNPDLAVAILRRVAENEGRARVQNAVLEQDKAKLARKVEKKKKGFTSQHLVNNTSY